MPTILHLSDLHFGFQASGLSGASAVRRQLVLDSLLLCLRTLPQEWQPDTVLISGDLGWQGGQQDYQKAGPWLRDLLKTCALSEKRLLICPGNHDLDRRISSRLSRPADANDARHVLAPPLAEIPFTRAFEAFTEFCADFGLPTAHLGAEENYLSGVVELGDLRVLLLNSAWCSRGDDDQGRLWLGWPQLELMQEANDLRQVKDGMPLTIALLHHPFSALHPQELWHGGGADIEEFILCHSHLVLHGHVHGHDAGIVANQQGLTIGSGADERGLYQFRLLKIENAHLRCQTWECGSKEARWLLRAESGQALVHAPQKLISVTARLTKLNDARLRPFLTPAFYGRAMALLQLDAAWQACQQGTAAPRILTLIGQSGMGKSSLLAHWVSRLGERKLGGFDEIFAWSFDSQGALEGQANPGSEFLDAALRAFGDAQMADSSAAGWEKGMRIAQLCAQQQVLLVLDGIDALQFSPTSATPWKLQDMGLHALLQHLPRNAKSLCIVSSPYLLEPDLQENCQLLRLEGLSLPESALLLRTLGVRGTEQELQAAAAMLGQTPLHLRLLGSYLHETAAGALQPLQGLRPDPGKGQAEDMTESILDAYRRWLVQDQQGQQILALLSLLALLGPWARRSNLECLLQKPMLRNLTDTLFVSPQKGQARAPLTDDAINLLLNRLELAQLIKVERDNEGQWQAVWMHPLLAHVQAEYLRRYQPEAWRAAQARLFYWLSASAPVKTQNSPPSAIFIWQQAIRHACAGGLHLEALHKVYLPCFFQNATNFGSQALDAHVASLLAVKHFFVQPWAQVQANLPPVGQAVLFNLAGASLMQLNRLPEALQASTASVALWQDLQTSYELANALANQSVLNLMLGNLEQARSAAEASLEHALRIDNNEQRGASLVVYARVLHQMGDIQGALTLMQEAEQIQAARMPSHPFLSHAAGAAYVELLLDGGTDPAQVAQRAGLVLRWAQESNVPAALALEYVNLAHCALAACLAESVPGMTQKALAEADLYSTRALSMVRQYDGSVVLCRALKIRAEVCALQGKQPEAVALLDEAWELAQYGALRLMQIDLLLARLRLFAQGEKWPWANSSPQADLRQAAEWVEQSGYGRRREEVKNLQLKWIQVPNERYAHIISSP